MEKPEAFPAEVLGAIRYVLIEHMDTDQYGPWYQPRSIVTLGVKSGRIITDGDAVGGRGVESALLITMRDGNEYKLTLEAAPDCKRQRSWMGSRAGK